MKSYLGEAAFAAGRYEAGAKLFEKITVGEYVEFLTLPAYELIDYQPLAGGRLWNNHRPSVN